MELSSPESIRALLAAFRNPAEVRRRHAAQDAPRLARKNRAGRCKCGLCHQCLDNARWERIFAEKFADPEYYTRCVMHRASPLTSI